MQPGLLFCTLYDAQRTKKALIQFADNVGPDQDARAVWSEHSATYTTVSIDSLSGQRRPWSARAYAQADLACIVRTFSKGHFRTLRIIYPFCWFCSLESTTKLLLFF